MQTVIELETTEQRVLAAAMPMEAQRFSLVMDAELSDDENNQNKPLTNMLETRLCMSFLSNYEVHTY